MQDPIYLPNGKIQFKYNQNSFVTIKPFILEGTVQFFSVDNAPSEEEIDNQGNSEYMEVWCLAFEHMLVLEKAFSGEPVSAYFAHIDKKIKVIFEEFFAKKISF